MIGKNSAWRFGTAKGYGNTKYASFFFKTVLLNNPEIKAFEIKMPKYLINNTEVELPRIKFNLDNEGILTSLP